MASYRKDEQSSTPTHTPGPWAVKTYRYTKRGATYTRPAVIAASGHYITTEINASSLAIGETAANAHLIAAAPELLASLQEILYAWANGADGLDIALRGPVDDAQALVARLTAGSEATE